MSANPHIEDEEYASEDDSDFAPDDAVMGAADGGDGVDGEASDSDLDPNDGDTNVLNAQNRKRKRAAPGTAVPAGAEDEGFENSGDEAIISKGEKKNQKRKRRKKDAEADDDDGDDSAEGGLIKTRRMRATDKAERKMKKKTAQGPVTVNVDDIWADLMAAPVVPVQTTSAASGPRESGGVEEADAGEDASRDNANATQPIAPVGPSRPAMIRIQRTYNFAGRVHTEGKLVSRDSAEAKVYLGSLGDKANSIPNEPDDPDPDHQENPNEDDDDDDPTTRRQPRKAFRSAFEPVAADGSLLFGRDDLDLGVATRLQMREERARNGKAKKLNVVEKSRMDWAGFVDREGIKDDLEMAGRSKSSYASRQDFLARVEAKREDEARRARMATRV